MARKIAAAMLLFLAGAGPSSAQQRSVAPSGPAVDLGELQLVVSDPGQVRALAARKSAMVRQFLDSREPASATRSLPPRAALSEPTRQWLDRPSTGTDAADPLALLVALASESASTEVGVQLELLAEEAYSRALVQRMIAQFPRQDARLGAIIEGTESFGSYSAASEALLRYEPEGAEYFAVVAERLDPLSQASASAAAWSRVEDEARIREWLRRQPEESLSLIAWKHGGFPPGVSELSRQHLERVAPTVDWSVHAGGIRRLELVEFYVSYLTDAELVLPRGAFEFLLGVARYAPAPPPQDEDPKDSRRARRVMVVSDDAQSRLMEALVEDADLGQQVLLAGGESLYSTRVVASIIGRLSAPTSFFRKLLDELSIEDQALLVVAAAARLSPATGELESWVSSLTSDDVELLVQLGEALDPATRAALDSRQRDAA